MKTLSLLTLLALLAPLPFGRALAEDGEPVNAISSRDQIDAYFLSQATQGERLEFPLLNMDKIKVGSIGFINHNQVFELVGRLGPRTLLSTTRIGGGSFVSGNQVRQFATTEFSGPFAFEGVEQIDNVGGNSEIRFRNPKNEVYEVTGTMQYNSVGGVQDVLVIEPYDGPPAPANAGLIGAAKRVWTSRDGNHKTEGTLTGFDKGVIRINVPEKGDIEVKLTDLSPEDIEYMRERMKKAADHEKAQRRRSR